MGPLRLVIFDVDGTLIDSQAHILASMRSAFDANGMEPPDRADVLSIVGLSLPVAMARLAPERRDLTESLVEAYKAAFVDLRQRGDPAALSPFYPGAEEVLHTLAAQDETLLAVATGKSRRGLDHVFDTHAIRPLFQSVQCADDHPSKPHPSMIEACLRETGVEAGHAVIVGDTTYDIAMGRAAGIHAVGVAWGYHPAQHLLDAGAVDVLTEFAALPDVLQRIWTTR